MAGAGQGAGLGQRLPDRQPGGQAPLPPKAQLAWWYQFYFATPRGAAGYARNTRAFARLIWGQASPQWKFDDATFDAAPRLSTIPTITLEGDANGAPHPEPAAYAGKFTGRYEHRLVGGGIGHNLPQEAPRAFADAVIAVDKFEV